MDREKAKIRIEERKNKKARKVSRCRGLKNFLLWFTGVLSSFVLLAVGIFVAVKVVPVKTYTGNKTDEIVSENISSKSLYDAIMGYKEYTVADIPALSNALRELGESSGVSEYVHIDYDKLNGVKFFYEGGETNMMTEFQSCIKVTATIESIGGEEVLGDLNKIDAFSEWTEVTPEELNSALEGGNIKKNPDGTFVKSPKLYYYAETSESATKFSSVVYEDLGTNIKYIRAFDDEGRRVAPGMVTTFYLPALSKIPVMDVLDVLNERLGTVKVNDLINVFSSGGESVDSTISKILGNYTINDVTTITPDSIHLIDVLGDSTGPVYDIISDATGKSKEEVTVGDITKIQSFDNIKLSTVLEYEKNKKVYDILLDVTNYGKADGDKVLPENLTIANLQGFDIAHLRLSTILSETESNKTLFNILRDVTGKGAGADILIEDFQNFNTTNLKLNTVIVEADNQMLFDILRDATGKTAGEDILVSDFNSFTPDNIKLSSVIKTSENKVVAELLKDDSVTIGNLGSKINNLSITNIFDGTDCFTKVVNGREYSKVTGNGKVYYIQTSLASSYASANGLNVEESGYYISNDATMWLFIQYGKLSIAGGTIDSQGYAKGYEDKDLTIKTMGSKMKDISGAFMNASIRELNVSGVLAGSYNDVVYTRSLQEIINQVNSLPIIP